MEHGQSRVREGSAYPYVLFLATLVSLIGIGAWFLFLMAAVGTGRMMAEFSGDFGDFSSPASTGTIISLAFAFIASLVSLGAAWKILREGYGVGALITITALQVAAAAVFHYWHSLVPGISAVVAIYGLTVARTPSGVRNMDVLRTAFQSATDQRGQNPTVLQPQMVAEAVTTGGVVQCQSCLTANPADARFCVNCGGLLS